MRKLTRNNLDMMSVELKQMVPAEQRRCLGGTGKCTHGISYDDMCYQCGDNNAVSWDTFVHLSEAGIWPGGFYIAPDGQACYSPASSSGDVVTGYAVVTGVCKQHGTIYGGTECVFAHTGSGDEYCEDHLRFYTDTCSDCSDSATGFCEDHDRFYPYSENCPVCSDDSGDGENEGDGENNNSGEVGKNICPFHGEYSGNVCSACYIDNSTGSNPNYSIDQVVDRFADFTFNREKLQQLKSALDDMCYNDVGKYIYDQLFSTSGDPILFTIGETTMVVVDGEEQPAKAQYLDGVVTYHPDTDISYLNLGEELVHALQDDIYGSDMTVTNLNYEFEAKLVNSLIVGDMISFPSMGYDQDQGLKFMEFQGKIKSGNYTWEELKPDYQEHFSNWNSPGYTDKPGTEKPMDFDSRLIEQLIELYKK